MKDAAVWLVATAGGLGKSPKAPGTVGSIGALIAWYLLLANFELPWLRLTLLLIVTALGWWCTEQYLRKEGLNEHSDPSEVVIDEWAGLYLALLMTPHDNIYLLFAAFLLFRLFDISKPWPVSQLERLPRSHGIMLDDLAAGLIALCLLLPFQV